MLALEVENNFTPINIEKLKGEENRLNTILLLIATVTVFILAVMLFVLIQKKIKTSQQEIPKMPLPTATITPEEREESSNKINLSPTNLPSLTENEVSSPSPNTNLFPAEAITDSSKVETTESAR